MPNLFLLLTSLVVPRKLDGNRGGIKSGTRDSASQPTFELVQNAGTALASTPSFSSANAAQHKTTAYRKALVFALLLAL